MIYTNMHITASCYSGLIGNYKSHQNINTIQKVMNNHTRSAVCHDAKTNITHGHTFVMHVHDKISLWHLKCTSLTGYNYNIQKVNRTYIMSRFVLECFATVCLFIFINFSLVFMLMYGHIHRICFSLLTILPLFYNF